MHLHILPDAAEWHKMFFPELPWLEKTIRPVCVYLFLLVCFRFTGKRELGQATLFDFLIILLISNVVQNAIIGDDTSIFGSFSGVVTLLILTYFLNKITSGSIKARRLLEGMPTLLVHDGRILEKNMAKESVSRNDLLTDLREQGVASLSEVRYAILELDGHISVIKNDAPRPDSRDNCVTVEIIDQDPEVPSPFDEHPGPTGV